MWIRTELRICHLYKRPRIWLQDEGTGKVLLKVREDPDLIKLAKQNRQSLQIRDLLYDFQPIEAIRCLPVS
jgi:hypothetical protein